MYLYIPYSEAVIYIDFHFFYFFLEFLTLPNITRYLTACEKLRLSTENTTLDAYRPKCTANGEYEPLQCHRRMFNEECWCVDKLGNEVTGSRMMQPNIPDCITGRTALDMYATHTSVCIGYSIRPHIHVHADQIILSLF